MKLFHIFFWFDSCWELKLCPPFADVNWKYDLLKYNSCHTVIEGIANLQTNNPITTSERQQLNSCQTLIQMYSVNEL